MFICVEKHSLWWWGIGSTEEEARRNICKSDNVNGGMAQFRWLAFSRAKRAIQNFEQPKVPKVKPQRDSDMVFYTSLKNEIAN